MPFSIRTIRTDWQTVPNTSATKYAKQYFLAPLMIFISRIDNSPSSRVVNAILHPNDSNGSTNCAQYLSPKICKAVFLSPTNDFHFSDWQLFFSGRKWCSRFVRFEGIDNLNTMRLNHSRWSLIFLSPTNEIHFSDRQLCSSGREWCSPFVRFVRIDNL